MNIPTRPIDQRDRTLIPIFEHLAQNYCNAGVVDAGDLVGLRDLPWLGQNLISEQSSVTEPGTVRSLFQALIDRFLVQPTWHVVCVVPGIPIASHPASRWLSADASNGTMSAQWSFFVTDGDGQRPWSVRLQTAPSACDSMLLRACAIARSQLWHSVDCDSSLYEQRSNELSRAEEALTEGNPAPIREYVLSHGTDGKCSSSANLLFGAAWELLFRVCTDNVAPVGAGAWRLPDAGPRYLATRIRAAETLARILVRPADLRNEELRINLFDWMLAQQTADRAAVRTTIDALLCAHAIWRKVVSSEIAKVLQKRGILKSSAAAQQVQQMLLLEREAGLPVEVAHEVQNYLIAHGHLDWAEAVHAAVVSTSEEHEHESPLIGRMTNDALSSNAALPDHTNNLIVGIVLFLFVATLSAFGAALMGSNAGEIAQALGNIMGAALGTCGAFSIAIWLLERQKRLRKPREPDRDPDG